MQFINRTKNQHFVSQTEQRLNARNPNAKSCNQEIYKFKIIDRKKHQVAAGRSVKIENSLSLHDLFSFDVLDKDNRYNFEELFSKYESELEKNTTSLLKNINSQGLDVKGEIINIFLSKFLNFVRNPYTIKKVLNSFPVLKNLQPTDEKILSNYEKVTKGKKPQIEHLCKRLNLPQKDYIDWLRIIFLLKTVKLGDYNFFEHLIAELFNNPKTITQVDVYQYDQDICLLSDRGFINSIDHNGILTYEFNLDSKNFIRFLFADIQAVAPIWADREIISKYCALPKNIQVTVHKNDMDSLDSYNKLVIYQSFEHVFAAQKSPFGVNIDQTEIK
ncbi:hypothetical protein [Terasakiella pusilla]|uniref:hypothetical protein n=1 Tax=Terasakiella pusilla TaxID=64973 RepID=UPI003AA85703